MTLRPCERSSSKLTLLSEIEAPDPATGGSGAGRLRGGAAVAVAAGREARAAAKGAAESAVAAVAPATVAAVGVGG